MSSRAPSVTWQLVVILHHSPLAGSRRTAYALVPGSLNPRRAAPGLLERTSPSNPGFGQMRCLNGTWSLLPQEDDIALSGGGKGLGR